MVDMLWVCQSCCAMQSMGIEFVLRNVRSLLCRFLFFIEFIHWNGSPYDSNTCHTKKRHLRFDFWLGLSFSLTFCLSFSLSVSICLSHTHTPLTLFIFALAAHHLNVLHRCNVDHMYYTISPSTTQSLFPKHKKRAKLQQKRFFFLICFHFIFSLCVSALNV